ncbi:putative membrane protein [Myxococcus hansupus]|uniref:Putative membrane protein n=1 Tax=Pseudomyxococcus hansupus TaxID=1297742 RepID=A0A0H4XDZ0_9BACT|nr:bestrophin family ion channel [Myxococcus hansupus]AKQ66287.1 putative membrane protein [Myxococcus hansupus]
MIDYDPHRWWSYFHYLRGSMVREIVARVLVCVVWAAGVTAGHRYLRPLDIPATVHTLAGISLSLLLVFRTNASYDRFWEGRKLWGGIVNETRNLARAAGVFIRHDVALYSTLLRWISTFPYASTANLRGERDLGPVATELPRDEANAVLSSQHVPLAVAQKMSAVLDEGRRRGYYSEYVQMQLDQNVQLLIDYIGGCERIHKTPIPFAYMMHLRRALLVYCYTLPFALVDSFGWLTVLATFIVAYIFFGIEEIGVEIEDPFGHDDNDLPLERISETIRANLKALMPGGAEAVHAPVATVAVSSGTQDA